MTMHLEKPFITTTRYNGKRKGSNSAKLKAAKAEHEAWLAAKGLSSQTIGSRLSDKHGRRRGVAQLPDLKVRNSVPLSNNVDGNGFVKPNTQYTGTEIVGIGVMHKSNAVPILRGTTQAQEISSMRR